MTSAKICLHHHHRLIKAGFREAEETPGLQSAKKRPINAKNESEEKAKDALRNGGEVITEREEVSGQTSHQMSSGSRISSSPPRT